MLTQVATNLITRYGSQQNARLILLSDKTYNKVTRNYDLNESIVDIVAYVVGYPSTRVDGTTIKASDRRILIRIDDNFNGNIPDGSQIEILGERLGIVQSQPYRIVNQVAYVEVQARG